MEKVHEANWQPPENAEIVPETHKCEKCSREFVTEHALLKHITEHNNVSSPNPNPNNAAGKTAKKVSSTSAVKNSSKSPAKDDEVKATCPQCNQTFRRLFNMRTHVDRVSKQKLGKS